jgi:hypothetical protein
MMSKEAELNETEPNHLTRKQVEAIPHLIGARSLEQGRKKAKVGKATLYEWLKDEGFKSELERQREGVITDALERLKTGITRAVDGLLELSEDKQKGIRLRACERILDCYWRSKEMDELEKRLERIEKIVSERRLTR